MKNLKVLLPMLAFIFAVGMAFATTEPKEEPEVQVFDYILIDGDWVRISEQGCTGTAKNCQVRVGEGGPLYDVYDEMNLNTLKQAPTDHRPPVINL